jgi:uncharacterized protein YkwD
MPNYTARRCAAACSGVLTCLAMMLMPSASVAAARCAGSDVLPGSAPRALTTKAVICEINRQRARRGLGKVRADRRLSRTATRHARAMVRQRFFAHTSPAGATMTERLRASGYGRGRWAAGEALAWGTGSRATPRGVVRVWMHSPPHRAVVLGRTYRDVGIGVALGSPYRGAMRGSATYAAELGRAAR